MGATCPCRPGVRPVPLGSLVEGAKRVETIDLTGLPVGASSGPSHEKGVTERMLEHPTSQAVTWRVAPAVVDRAVTALLPTDARGRS